MNSKKVSLQIEFETFQDSDIVLDRCTQAMRGLTNLLPGAGLADIAVLRITETRNVAVGVFNSNKDRFVSSDGKALADQLPEKFR